jgi:hypothetical protein
MTDISGSGLEIEVKASETFPSGFTVTQFTEAADMISSDVLAIAETAMGANGDIQSWGTPSVIPLTINVIPNTDDYENLRILCEANRLGKGKTRAGDEITVILSYVSGSRITLSNGTPISFPAVTAISGDGRINHGEFTFNFENITVN